MAQRRKVVAAVNRELEQRFGFRVVRIKEDEAPEEVPPPVEAPKPRIPVRRPADPRDRLVQRPVFLLSSVRSGSTLSRVILNSHSQIHSPHEMHFRRTQVIAYTEPVQQALEHLDLNERDLEHLLWDRMLHRELVQSGKSVLVEKTPSNVFVADRLATAWPKAKFIYLIRHPWSIAQSWHEGDPEKRPLKKAIHHTLNYMEYLEKARNKRAGLTLRYEDLTSEPAKQTQLICEFLGLEWEPGMLEYGKQDHGGFVKGIGDWKDKIKTGTIQQGRPLPDISDVPVELRPMCERWGY
ncbi:sulfotransferase [Kineosporia sp. J2-2]|uniref:Sulfotransferase n=1 Tax=Kineosporia corallincola TaxID=2835133 RepID=A0ABS5TS41_9ACTN|nr:sulfotransferase [Kineosporia corallincola]MBT0773610.1 sulfotransferase [Kineosporia corallincola]